MAVWQNDYFVLPQSKLAEFYGEIPANVPENDFYERLWWAGVPSPEKTEIERILPPFKQWGEASVRWWGTSDAGHRISLVYTDDGKSITEFSVRVDLSGEYRSFVQQTVGLMKRRRWAFLSCSGSILMPEYDVIAKDLSQSDAQEFVTDVQAWIEEKRKMNSFSCDNVPS